MSDFIIDAEFQSLLLPLSGQEREQLEASIVHEGRCLEPLVVWKRDDGEKILLDGHNRYDICNTKHLPFTTINIKRANREAAKLWILEHQVARRNLTDDQRAVVWNEIRQQRSKVAREQQLAEARRQKVQPSVSAETTDTAPQPKHDTRAEVAAEARLPENKLRQAQKLKKYQPELYEKVRMGEVRLRNISKLMKPATPVKDLKKRFADRDHYRRMGRSIDTKLKESCWAELAAIKKSEWSPEAEEGFKELIGYLRQTAKTVNELADKYAAILKASKVKAA